MIGGNEEDGYGFTYSDNSLPGGGKIIEIGYTPEYGTVSISGSDKDGNTFAYSYISNSFAYGLPNLSNDGIAKLQSVGSKFTLPFV